MPLDLATIVTCIIIGALTGGVAAFCGIGGGVIMVPAFVWFLPHRLNQRAAAATSLAAILMTSLVASLKNQTNQLIDWKVALTTGLASALVAWFAAGYLRKIQNVTLSRVFAVVIILVGVWTLWSSFRSAKAAPPPDHAPTTTPADTVGAGK